MTQIFTVHLDNPQPRLIKKVAEILAAGGLVAVPTDSGYALVARLDDRDAADALRKSRGLDQRHHLTLLCRDLSEISHFAKVDNAQYRMLKHATPGPWTFILPASKEVPKRLSHPSRKTIGIRLPPHHVTQALLTEIGQALVSTTLIAPGDDKPMANAQDIQAKMGHAIQAIIDSGDCPWEPTTVIDLTSNEPIVVRHGRGNLADIGLA